MIWSVLASSPWRRAPLLVWRYPPVVVAVAGVALVLAVTGASAPLFLSSTANAALAGQLANRCPANSGFVLDSVGQVTGRFTPTAAGPPVAAAAVTQDRERLLGQATGGIAHLGPVVRTVRNLVVEVGRTGHAPERVSVMWRQGGLAHVDRLAEAGGHGVWLADTTAGRIGVRAGQTIKVRDGRAAGRVRVAGIYRDLASQPRSPFWCSVARDVYAGSVLQTAPPPVMLADSQAILAAVSRDLHHPEMDFQWERALERPLTVSQVAETLAGVQAADRLLVARDFPGRLQSNLGFVVARSRAVGAAMRSPVIVMAVTGALVALVLLAAAGRLWVERRRREVALLAAKGVAPLLIGVKAAAETIGPVALGGLLGWQSALWLVRALGPSRLLEPTAVDAAGRLVVLTGVAGMVTLGLVATAGARRLTEAGPGRPPLRRAAVPWELVLVAGALAAFLQVRRQGLPVVQGTTVPGLDVEQLLFPLLWLAGLTLVGVRILRAGLLRLRARGAGWPTPLYLANRRLGGAVRVTLTLVFTATLAIGILVFAATLTFTLRSTVDAKAKVFLGSDARFELFGRQPVPAALASTATLVQEGPGAVGGRRVDLLGVDPATFARAAFWDRRFSADPLTVLLERLARPGGGELPVVVVGDQLPDRFSLEVGLGTSPRAVTARVVGRAVAFPGLRANPLVVADQRRLSPLAELAATELWVRGDLGRARAALLGSHSRVRYEVTLAEVSHAPDLLAVIWTYGFLQALGALTGLIAIGGLLLYLETRQRGRQLAYVMSRRMGLTRRQHWLSLLTEIGATFGVSLAGGTALSGLAAWLVHRDLDPVRGLPPGPLFDLPPALLVVTTAAVAVVCAGAATLAQASADRARPADLLRLGG
jgi:putative ABC transport system permease protein